MKGHLSQALGPVLSILSVQAPAFLSGFPTWFLQAASKSWASRPPLPSLLAAHMGVHLGFLCRTQMKPAVLPRPTWAGLSSFRSHPEKSIQSCPSHAMIATLIINLLSLLPAALPSQGFPSRKDTGIWTIKRKPHCLQIICRNPPILNAAQPHLSCK